MKQYLYLFFLCCILFSVNNASSGDDPQKIIASIQKKYSQMEDLTLSFTRKIKFNYSKDEKSVKGTVLIKHGNMLRIEVDNKTITTDGDTLWTYIPQHNQVIVDHYDFDQRGLAPQKILTTLPKESTSQVLGREKLGEKEMILLQLTSKDSNTSFQLMKIWVDPREWSMRQIEIQDISGNTSIYTIDEIKFNTGIADSTFIFKVPRGTEIIDMRD